MIVTYYLDLMSSWCHWAEPTWAALQSKFAGQAQFEWRIASMRPDQMPSTLAQCEWFYRRSGTLMRSASPLHPGWFDPALGGDYRVPNLVAEAGRDFGITDDRLRLVLAEAGLREGKKIGALEVCLALAQEQLGLDPAALRARAGAAEVAERVRLSTATFHQLGLTQRPAFVLENAIHDRVTFSGLTQLAPLVASMEALLHDEAGYASYAAHHGGPPSA